MTRLTSEERHDLPNRRPGEKPSFRERLKTGWERFRVNFRKRDHRAPAPLGGSLVVPLRLDDVEARAGRVGDGRACLVEGSGGVVDGG